MKLFNSLSVSAATLFLIFTASCGGPATQTPVEAVETVTETVSEEIVAEPPAKFSSESGMFSADFFGETNIAPESITTDDGKEKTVYYYEKSENELYTISYVDLPADVLTNEDASDIFASVREGYGGIIESESQINLGDFTGIRFKSKNGEVFSDVAAYFTGTRLYELSAMSAGTYAPEADVNAFISSFGISR